MRQGQQHRRGRSRSNNGSSNINNHPGNRKGQNPLTRSFESNGPDVKVRGTPAHIAEKYLQLARDAQSSGDHVLAENYLQHAEHYNRIIFAYREQQVQQSGDVVNGHGRHHNPSRNEMMDGDDAGSDDMGGSDEGMGGDQPMIVRHPGSDAQPSLDDHRHQQRQGEHPPRFRDRHGGRPQERHDRPERQHDRAEGFDRGDRPERTGDRGFDRNRERSYRPNDQQGEGREFRAPREHREPRLPRDPREPREMREPRPMTQEVSREMPREIQRDIPMEISRDIEPSVELPVAVEAPARAEATPRRRERFGLTGDQPEFLRRPVRRPRREPDQDLAPELPAASAATPPDDTPRE
jgi:hypothetical protein